MGSFPPRYESKRYEIYENVAFFQSLMMQMWDTSHWGTDKSDDRFQRACDFMSSSQLGDPPVASEEHSAVQLRTAFKLTRCVHYINIADRVKVGGCITVSRGV